MSSDSAEGLPLSMARNAGDLVFLSGQASVDEDGDLVPGTFEEEMRRSLDNVAKVLESEGLGFDDVVRVTGYVRDPDNRSAYNRIYREYFSVPFPARTTLTNCLPPEIHFEIDVIAVRRV